MLPIIFVAACYLHDLHEIDEMKSSSFQMTTAAQLDWYLPFTPNNHQSVGCQVLLTLQQYRWPSLCDSSRAELSILTLSDPDPETINCSPIFPAVAPSRKINTADDL